MNHDHDSIKNCDMIFLPYCPSLNEILSSILYYSNGPSPVVFRSREKYTHLKSEHFNNTEAFILTNYFVHMKICVRTRVTCWDTKAVVHVVQVGYVIKKK